MAQIESDFIELLTLNGYSVTEARILLFKLLLGKEPMTMSEITHNASNFSDRATVYRNISLFDRLGVIHKLQIGWKYKIELSDRFHPHHHHITCQSCGKTETINLNEKLENFFNLQAESLGYILSDHQLELSGVCKLCKKT